MTIRMVIASHNANKVREIRQILGDLGFDVVSAAEFPEVPEVEEDGVTFAENALKKARTVAEALGELTLADDSGLEVDALGGRPGVYSARYAGEPKSDARNNAKLLRELAGVPPEQRGAQFRCIMALVYPNGFEQVFEGICRGCMASEPRGETGFGYDPLFVVPEHGKTMAELGQTIKNCISHRSKALEQLKDALGKMEQSS